MTDTLQNIVKLDSLLSTTVDSTAVSEPVMPVADSVVLCSDSVWIGGQGVRTVAEVVQQIPLEQMLSNPMIQSVLLLGVLVYLVVMCQRYTEAVDMSMWLFYPSANNVCEERADWRMGLPWRILGLFTTGCVGTMLLYKVVAQPVVLSPIVVLLGVTMAIISSWIVESFLLGISGSIVLQQRFTQALIAVRRYTVDMAGVWLTPVAVGCALSSGGMSEVLWWIVLVMSAILVFVHSLKILNLFIGARFSIFFWILYLCAVEILPKSLAVAVTLGIL